MVYKPTYNWGAPSMYLYNVYPLHPPWSRVSGSLVENARRKGSHGPHPGDAETEGRWRSLWQWLRIVEDVVFLECVHIYIYTIMHYHVWHIYIYIYWYYNIYIDVLKACFFQTHIFFWGILQILWGESWVYFGMLSNQYLGITSQNEDHNGCSPYIYIHIPFE